LAVNITPRGRGNASRGADALLDRAEEQDRVQPAPFSTILEAEVKIPEALQA
jgi:hypothetical protein